MKKILITAFLLFITINHIKPQNINIPDNRGNNNEVLCITTIFTGINLYMTVNNFTKLKDTDNPKQNAVLGIATGVAQILYSLTIKKDDVISENNITSQTYKTVNIAMGSLTVASSVVRLICKQPSKNKTFTWNIFCNPKRNNKVEINIGIVKKINI